MLMNSHKPLHVKDNSDLTHTCCHNHQR